MALPPFEFIGPRGARPWTELSFQLPATIPTMITREEAKYLCWLTRNLWDDSGHVVEMGPWLGGSTYCLASGMARATAPTHRLHVFDSFEWRDFMASRAPLDLASGASFEGYFRQNLSPFGELVQSRRAVLPDELLETDSSLSEYRSAVNAAYERLEWRDGPIQLLFVDGAKSWTGMLHLLRQTAPHFIAGKTVLVCQDYKHWGCYWVTALTELLSHRLRLLHVIERNTVAFLVESLPSADELLALPSFSDANLSSVLALLDSAAARLRDVGDDAGASIVLLGKVPLLVHRGEPLQARREFRLIEAGFRWPAHERNLNEARDWLATRLGEPLPESRRHRLTRKLLSLASLGKRTLRRLVRTRGQRQ